MPTVCAVIARLRASTRFKAMTRGPLSLNRFISITVITGGHRGFVGVANISDEVARFVCGVAGSVGRANKSGVGRLAEEFEEELLVELLPGMVGIKNGVVGYRNICVGSLGVMKHSAGNETTFLSVEFLPAEEPVPVLVAVVLVPSFA